MNVIKVDKLLAEPLDARFRAFGARPGLSVGDVGAQGFSLRDGELPFPVLALRASALEHNLRVMHGWCEQRGLSLAPHGKTHLSPQLVRRQLEAGAWGMTAANVHQVAVLRAGGARRVLVANQVFGRAEVAWLERQRREDPELELSCLVDSERGVDLLDGALAGAGAQRPLAVLVEIGVPGTRAGCRSDDEARAVAAAVRRAPHLQLVGVEGYEGSIGADRGEDTLAVVDAFLDRLAALADRLDGEGAFADCDEILVSAGGSAFFDRVAERVRFDRGLSRPVRVLLRSGCYLTHDHGHYERLSPLRSSVGRPPLRPAFALWAQVLSRPEPRLAIAGFGKRDAPFDLDLPLPEAVVGASGERRPAPAGLRVVATNDQHAYVELGSERDVEVGEVLVCGISHPCTAFDKWSLLPVVDDDDIVVDAVRTLF